MGYGGRTGVGMVMRANRSFGRTLVGFIASFWVAFGGVDEAAAQDASAKVTASTLLNSGFEIVATNYLTKSIVITLQRSNRGFLCELGFDGKTVQCIEIK